MEHDGIDMGVAVLRRNKKSPNHTTGNSKHKMKHNNQQNKCGQHHRSKWPAERVKYYVYDKLNHFRKMCFRKIQRLNSRFVKAVENKLLCSLVALDASKGKKKIWVGISAIGLKRPRNGI